MNGIWAKVAAFLVGAAIVTGSAAIVQVRVMANDVEDNEKSITEHRKRLRKVEDAIIRQEATNDQVSEIRRKVDALLVNEGLQPKAYEQKRETPE